MRSIEKKPTTTKRTGSSVRGSGSRIGDADSTRLQNISSKMGNGDLSKHLEGNGNQRDRQVGQKDSRGDDGRPRGTLGSLIMEQEPQAERVMGQGQGAAC